MSTKFMKIIYGAAFLAIMTAYVTSPHGFLAFAGQGKAQKPLIVIGEWSPYTSSTAANNGVFTEIVKMACKASGIDCEVKFYPWKRCEEMVKSGAAWATFPYVYVKERTTNYNYSAKILPDSTKLFYMKTNKKIILNGLDPGDLKTFRQYSFAGIVGYSYEKAFRNAGLNVDWSYGEDDVIHKLVHGRVDFIAQNDIIALDSIKRLYPKEYDKVGIMTKPISRNDFYLIASKKYTGTDALLNKFNTGLKKITDNKSIETLMKKYQLMK